MTPGIRGVTLIFIVSVLCPVPGAAQSDGAASRQWDPTIRTTINPTNISRAFAGVASSGEIDTNYLVNPAHLGGAAGSLGYISSAVGYVDLEGTVAIPVGRAEVRAGIRHRSWDDIASELAPGLDVSQAYYSLSSAVKWRDWSAGLTAGVMRDDYFGSTSTSAIIWDGGVSLSWPSHNAAVAVVVRNLAATHEDSRAAMAGVSIQRRFASVRLDVAGYGGAEQLTSRLRPQAGVGVTIAYALGVAEAALSAGVSRSMSRYGETTETSFTTGGWIGLGGWRVGIAVTPDRPWGADISFGISAFL